MEGFTRTVGGEDSTTEDSPIVLVDTYANKISENHFMREWKRKRTVKQRYDTTADIYERRYAEEQEDKIEAALKHFEVKEGVILDVGCGTGLLFSHVAEKAAMIVGLDLSRRSLIVAKRRLGTLRSVDLIQADADYMPFRGRVFSHAFAFTLIQNLPDPARALKELKRVAARNAVLVVTGLKRVFGKEAFLALLRDVGVHIVALEDGDNLKCYVAICASIRH